MLKTNYHTHSKFCDGTGSLEDYVIKAVDKGFNVLGFSSHAPLPFTNDWTMPKDQLTNYITELNRLKNAYKNIITIKTGLEIDYIEDKMALVNKLYKGLKLDFIIGSVHMIKNIGTGEFLSIEYTKREIEQLIKETFKGDTKALVKEYYRLLRSMSSGRGFDIIGHMDVIKKINVNNIYFDETTTWYKEEIIQTLACISKNKQILEINTGKVLNDPERIYPSPWILKLANKYNIPIMLNSDAHRPDRLDNYFYKAKKMILDAGYEKLKVLKENEWEDEQIDLSDKR